MSNDKLAQIAPDLGRRLDEAIETIGLAAACSIGEDRRTYTWLAELMKEAGRALAAHEAEKQAGPDDTQRCIDARNRLNAALHGDGAVIDSLEHAVASVCAKLAEKQAGPVAGEVVYLHRLSKFEGGKWVPATELIAGEPAPEWVELASSKPDLWRVDRRVTGSEIARGIARAVQASATDAAPPSESDKEDAERWRELRRQHEGDAVYALTVFGPDDDEGLSPIGSLPGELDAAIDAARAKKEQP